MLRNFWAAIVACILIGAANQPVHSSLLHHSNHVNKGKDRDGHGGNHERSHPYEIIHFVKSLLEECSGISLSDCLERRDIDVASGDRPDKDDNLHTDLSSGHHHTHPYESSLQHEDELVGFDDEKEEEVQETAIHFILRMIVALALICMGYAAAWAYHRIDDAPPWLRGWIIAKLDAHEDHISSTESGVSKLMQYKLDQKLSNSPSFKLVFLGLITGLLIVLGSMALFVVGEDTMYTAFWSAVAGSGLDWTFSDKAIDATWSALLVRAVSLMVSVGGMLVTALLLGLVSDAIGEKVDELKKGKAAVLESNHTLIIGWSDKIYTLVMQLCMGKAVFGGNPIVILSERGKEEMEELLSQNPPRDGLQGSTISCRTGDPLMRAELMKVSAQHASSIIILADEQKPDQSDARVIHVVLSLMVMHKELQAEGKGGIKGVIVAEVCDRDHEDLLMRMGNSNMLFTVIPREISALLMVQCAKHPQMLAALLEVMSFDGNEFYVAKNLPPLMTGIPFHLLQSVYPKAVPVGIRRASGKLVLKPHPDMAVEDGDSIVMVADDDSCLDPDFELLEATAAKLKGETLQSYRKTRQALTCHGESKATPSETSSTKDKGPIRPSVLLSKSIAMVARQLRQSSQYGLRTVYEIVSPTPSQKLMHRTSYRESSVPSILKSGSDMHVSKSVPVSQNGSAVQVEAQGSQSSFSTKAQRAGYGFFMTLDWMRAVDHASHPPKREESMVSDSNAGLEAGLLALERRDNNNNSSSLVEGVDAKSNTPWWERWSVSMKDPVRSSSARLAHCNSLESVPGTCSSGGLLSRADKECSSPEDETCAVEPLVSDGRELPWWDRVLGSRGIQDVQEDAEESNKPWWDRVLCDQVSSGGGELTFEEKRRLHASKMQFTRQPSKPSMTTSIRSHESKQHFHGRFLICGWRRNMAGLLSVLNGAITAPSEVFLFSRVPLEARDWLLEKDGLCLDEDGRSPSLDKIRVFLREPNLVGNMVSRLDLQALDPLQFKAVIILTDNSDAASGGDLDGVHCNTMSAADSMSLTTMLLLRQAQLEQLHCEQEYGDIGDLIDAVDREVSTHIAVGASVNAEPNNAIRRLGVGCMEDSFHFSSADSITVDLLSPSLASTQRSPRQRPPPLSIAQDDEEGRSEAPSEPDLQRTSRKETGSFMEQWQARVLGAAGHSTHSVTPAGSQASIVTSPRPSLSMAQTFASVPVASSNASATLLSMEVAAASAARQKRITSPHPTLPLEPAGCSQESASEKAATSEAGRAQVVATTSPSALKQRSASALRPSIKFMDTDTTPLRHNISLRDPSASALKATQGDASQTSTTAAPIYTTAVSSSRFTAGGSSKSRSSSPFQQWRIQEENLSGMPQSPERVRSQSSKQSGMPASLLNDVGTQPWAPLSKFSTFRRGSAQLAPSARMHSNGSRRQDSGANFFSAMTDQHLEDGAGDDGSSSSGDDDANGDGEGDDLLGTAGLNNTLQELQDVAVSEGEGRHGVSRKGTSGGGEDKEGQHRQPGLKSRVGQKKPKQARGVNRKPGSSWQGDMRTVVKNTTFVTELLDTKTQVLVKDMQTSKYILSLDMASQLMALISCCPERHQVYNELLWPEGNTISVRPASTVLNKNECICFYEASERILLMGEVLIGWLDRKGETTCNPHDKTSCVLSRNEIELFLTVAWGGGEAQPDDWVPAPLE